MAVLLMVLCGVQESGLNGPHMSCVTNRFISRSLACMCYAGFQS
jgi:hypothetical protein